MPSQFKLNLVEGSVSFSFTPEAARDLQAAIATLMASLKATAAQGTSGSTRPQPKRSMEYQHTGDIFLEVFCNPNIWASPFAAKVLITLRDDRIRLNTEAELTRLIEDINLFLEQEG
ncbi:hypothetical protein IQ268_14535 [Oculatella sp. LEGE 06141]|uniref:hypothetical protein n=1 Tax=Oculatella sp. LEGE 06141 TaxID=1828648 RepID=UPI00188264EF|nr:hypothetical protein [Oculatella sp. LEGE 06141]MBE9179784.1 hypothetical protein [Oculatella sp. LEGE 06141]